jgi:hypothetical protein
VDVGSDTDEQLLVNLLYNRRAVRDEVKDLSQATRAKLAAIAATATPA